MRIPLLTLLVLAACNGTKDDSNTTETTTAPASNDAPHANAGTDQSTPGDVAVTLSGAGSTDPNGDALTYYWSFDHVPEGSTVETRTAAFSLNHSADAVTTTFTPDVLGTYIVGLMVRDTSNTASNTDFVIITVEEPETKPVAHAGTDIVVDAGDAATLDGSRSYDPHGRAITYSWTVVDRPVGSSASLSDATVVSPTLTTDMKGAYTATLVVHNGLTSSSGDSVTITATAEDNQPVANAGPDQMSAEDCTALSFDCSGSADPDGDALTYYWEVQTKPTGSQVSNATFEPSRNSAEATFYPDMAGTYVLSCAVSDGVNWSTPDTLTVVATDRQSNVPPTVFAGLDQTVDAGSVECEPSGYVWNCDECGDQQVTLGPDALATDSDGDPLTYRWEVEEGDADIANPTQLSGQVTLNDVEPEEAGACVELTYKFRLSVTDCTGAVTSDTVKYEVTCCGVEDTSSQ